MTSHHGGTETRRIRAMIARRFGHEGCIATPNDSDFPPLGTIVYVVGPAYTREKIFCTHCGKDVGPATFLPVRFEDGNEAGYNVDVLEIDEGFENREICRAT